jgi:hypothetical protein
MSYTNITSEWSGEEIDLHAPPKPIAVEPKHIHRAKKITVVPEVVETAQVAPLIGGPAEREIVHKIGKPRKPKTIKHIKVIEDSDILAPAPATTVHSQQEDSAIKKAFMDALASPLPSNTDPGFVAQVETARKALGIIPSVNEMPAPAAGVGPPVFDNSVDMKAAFTRAMESPLPQIPFTPQVAPILPVAKEGSVRIEHAVTEPIIAPMLVTAPVIVVSPTGQLTEPVDNHSRKITKFAPDKDGWTGTIGETEQPKIPISTPVANPHKQFTIDEAIS